MPYVTPIFDRTATDIANRTSKAFINVADWTRIYDNALFVNPIVGTALGLTIQFDTVSVPTSTTIPTVTDVNKLTGNIERMRVVAEAIGTVEVKDDYIAGAGQIAPDYLNVNDWEETIDIINTAYSFTPVRFARTVVAECGAGITRNNKWRHY